MSARCQCSQRWPGVEVARGGGGPGRRWPGVEVSCSISGPNDSTTMAQRAKDGNMSFRGDDSRLRHAPPVPRARRRPVLRLTRNEVAHAHCRSAAFAVSGLSPSPDRRRLLFPALGAEFLRAVGSVPQLPACDTWSYPDTRPIVRTRGCVNRFDSLSQFASSKKNPVESPTGIT